MTTGAPDGDPVALRSPAMCRFFGGVMTRQMRGGFRAVRVLKPGLPTLPPDRPLIVYANHPSWWDPAFFIVLAVHLLGDRESYGVMEAEALERYGFMKRIGLFGIDPAQRTGAVRFLRVGAHVLSDPRRMLWVTAQGEFTDPRTRPVALRSGLAHLMGRVPNAVAVPLAVEYPFWSEKRAEALCAFGPPIEAGGTTEGMQAALTDALCGTMDRLRDAAMGRDPIAFDRLAVGRRGTGGVYGLWSRARAIASGRRYDGDHLQDPTGR
ncbi:lysophospholipid acyltransferase family protein [Jannaschia sp. LMIT008]|uniref:lysophospholipid acyltransferase family protein n=1 Tax=Jannaschia maritima TaxID=3032585 RepID=UPI002811DAAB|nr:lysophospholipid acyltransferase family protein [Jannaschia sp. LMIT008]